MRLRTISSKCVDSHVAHAMYEKHVKDPKCDIQVKVGCTNLIHKLPIHNYVSRSNINKEEYAHTKANAKIDNQYNNFLSVDARGERGRNIF